MEIKTFNLNYLLKDLMCGNGHLHCTLLQVKDDLRYRARCHQPAPNCGW